LSLSYHPSLTLGFFFFFSFSFFPGQINQTLNPDFFLESVFVGKKLFYFGDVKTLVVKISPKIAKLIKFTLEKKILWKISQNCFFWWKNGIF
jgi:hypothetical protein